MSFLPKSPHLFLYWWAVKAPKHIFTVFKRILLIVNNHISFTTNLRLIFTPLFGDYTIIGRFIGFTVRIFEIVFGSIFVVAVSIVAVIAPVAWWLVPFAGFIEYKIYVLMFIAGGYLVWAFKTKNTPEKRIKDCKTEDCIRSFRPGTQGLYEDIMDNHHKGIEKLLKSQPVFFLLRKLELQNDEFKQKLTGVPHLDTHNLLSSIYEYAKTTGTRYIETEHLFVGLLKNLPNRDIFLSTYGTRIEMVERGTSWLLEEREKLAKMYIWQEDFESLFLGGTGKGMTGRVTPFLDSMSEDFTRMAVRGGYERFTMLERYIRKIGELMSGSNENILIIGPPGSGKTSLVRGIAYKIMQGIEFKSLSNKRIISLQLAGILSGTKTAGEIAEKLKGALAEAKGSGDIVLFIDEIHTLVTGGGDQNPEVATIYSLLEPELSLNKIQFIGATTIQNYRKYIEPNGAFARLFNILEIEEATREETINILKYVIREVERRKGVTVTYAAVERTLDLSKKLIHDRVLPDKAILIIDRAATYAAGNTKYLDTKAVEHVVADITHVPSQMISEEESSKLLNIEAEMKQMVIGQDHAIKQVAAALKRARAGIRNENKPIASFLFVGTTGVGKTQTSKALAKSYFGDAKNMIRLDMSEYQQLDSMSRLLGSPDGKSRGVLTEAVRTKPFALLLLDEIEKAHPNILLTFLQVLDEGRLTDSTGLEINFTNTLIIATSNVGTRKIQEIFAKNGNIDEMQESAMREVRSHFAPEFLNRFSGIIVFNPLTKENVRDITILLLQNVQKSADAKGIKIAFKPEVIEELIKRGYNPEWGARPLSRVIEDTVESYLAVKMLTKEFKMGDDIELGSEVFED
ncbi:ATP-dependent Clp protease ATP-binding subunit [candidate division WWE3 bacterium]|jgi:ATP-dependent Clp protease ATP-binding subunit ClpC|uniref:ATP-dependent Clp protease ATP-binding subunit n=1 Tax=candidate division WWE3 bacterium TaxID=2053526 RepID=A0A3A4ZE38_UNCKA|nr:MAG: ATP-dependent Clp protease ATP-binding subunit [candidate division WWE3 bacterium]